GDRVAEIDGEMRLGPHACGPNEPRVHVGYSITSLSRASRVGGTSRGIRNPGVTEHPLEDALLWLNVGRPDHLAPLLGFCGDEISKVSGRTGNHRVAEIGKLALILGSARATLISLLSFSMISAGVFLGAPIPCQPVAS